MSFSLIELAWWLRKPVAYFKFTRASTVWGYTTADRAKTVSGVTYQPAAIARSSIKLGTERRKQTITVTIPRDLPVAANWVPYPPRDTVRLDIFLKHESDAEVVLDWSGRVMGPKRGGPTIQLTCEQTQSRSARTALTRCWQRGCGLVLYSQGVGMCNVNKATHAVSAALTTVDATHFTAAPFGLVANGRLAGGYIEYPRATDGVMEYRTIMAHNLTEIEIDYPLVDIAPAQNVTAYPGCRQTQDDCVDYFNNDINYGGDPDIPQKDPHKGNVVW